MMVYTTPFDLIDDPRFHSDDRGELSDCYDDLVDQVGQDAAVWWHKANAFVDHLVIRHEGGACDCE